MFVQVANIRDFVILYVGESGPGRTENLTLKRSGVISSILQVKSRCMEAFLRNIRSILDAIDLCLEKGLAPPALILIYSCIDILGSLERAKSEGTKHSFIRWVEKYLIEGKSLDFTATDLYSARCAVLHTLTAESELSNQGTARKVVYSWGTAPVGDLKEAIKRLKKDVVSIHINELNEALVLGIDQYLEEVGKDESRRKLVITNGEKSFNNVPISIVTDFLSNSE